MIDYIYQMNLRDLTYLTTLADTGHFRRAAEACNVTQPTLSMQLRKLEEFLGVTLVERGGRHALLTPAGKEIVARARAILHETEAMRELARHFRDPFAGELSLGLFPTLAAYLLPLILPEINARFPALQLTLMEEKTPVLTEMLLAGKLDCALLALPIEEEGLQSTSLFHEPFLLAVAAGHPFARKKRISQEALSGKTLLLLNDGHCMREHALSVCRAIGAGESKQFRATSLETLRHMVAAKRGITLMPALSVRNDPLLSYIPFASPVPSRTVGLVWRKTSARHTLFECMAAQLGPALIKTAGGAIAPAK